jgi:YD repeat-containing protein
MAPRRRCCRPSRAYDDLGRATRASRRNAGGDVVTTERDFDPQGRVVRDALQVGGEPVLQVTSNWAAAATGWNRTVAYPTNAVWTRSNDRIGRLVALTGPQGNDIALNWQGEFYAGRSHSRGGAPALDEIATLDGLGRRIGWDFTAGSLHAYKAEATRDVVGRVASLTWGFGPSAADHWRGYGYDPATRLADAWSWDGLAPGPDVSSLVNHTVGPGQVGTLAGSLAGVVHAPFARAADGGDLLSIGDAYDVTSPRGPGHRLTEVEIDGVAVTVDHDATGRVVEVDPGYTFEYDPDERLMAVRDSGTGDVVEHYAYDADGRLAATYDANGLTQRFAWDGAQMVAARDGNGVAKWDAVWGTLDQLLSWRDLEPPTRSATWPCCRSPTTAAASWGPWSPTPGAPRCSPPRTTRRWAASRAWTPPTTTPRPAARKGTPAPAARTPAACPSASRARGGPRPPASCTCASAGTRRRWRSSSRRTRWARSTRGTCTRTSAGIRSTGGILGGWTRRAGRIGRWTGSRWTAAVNHRRRSQRSHHRNRTPSSQGRAEPWIRGPSEACTSARSRRRPGIPLRS